jgi:small subunit ribosomal protein S20
MANIASQIKRNRQNERRRLRNKAVRSELRTFQRKFRAAASEGDRETAEEAFRVISRKLDKAARKGVVHENYAANHKSRMARDLAAL